MKRLLSITAALVAAVAVLIAASLPQRRLELPASADGTVSGILHVHTNRSDGKSSPDEVAAAAARAGLRFLIFTDHGDATRPPDPPTYRSGVLCLDGIEISTTGGHYVALDMPASPYPLAGEPRDVIDDVRRLGGFGIAAHPDSPKPELQWSAWDAPFDGVELLNPDTSWRVWAQQAFGGNAQTAGRWAARRMLAFSLLDYPFRPAETIANLTQLDPPNRAVSQWAAIAARRRLVAVAGIDAHAKLELRGDPGSNGFSLPLPGYESSFRVLSVHATTDRPMTGNADADASSLMRAIRSGHLYVAVDGVATPPSFDFSATNARGTVHGGDEIAADGPVTLRVRSNAPAPFSAAIWSGSGILSGDHHEPEFTVTAPAEPGVYWVEIRSTGRAAPMTWLRSNPIYVRGRDAAPRPPARLAAVASQSIFDGRSVAAWRTEHDGLSAGAVELAESFSGNETRFRFGLAGGDPVGQFSAVVHDVPSNGFGADRVTFTARAERPMRISVQVRGGDGVVDRWQRSVYLDTLQREQTVYFDDCMPVGATHTPRAPLRSIASVMFVVDTTNSKPGASGRLWIKHAALQR